MTTSVFPSDELTRQYFKAQYRESQWVELKPDPGAPARMPVASLIFVHA